MICINIANCGLKRISRFYMDIYRDFDTQPRYFSAVVGCMNNEYGCMDNKLEQNESNRLYCSVAKIFSYTGKNTAGRNQTSMANRVKIDIPFINLRTFLDVQKFMKFVQNLK